MNDRGEYRAIYTVIVDGPDFQAFSPEAKLLFYTLKLSLGATGIGVIRAMVPTLSEQTGHDEPTVERALCELEDNDWIRREHNVVWIVRGFEFEPGLGVDNANHRKSVQRHIASLPNVGIIALFKRRYRAWFPDTDTPDDGITKGSEGHEEGMGNAPAIRREERVESRTTTSPREKPRGHTKPKPASSASAPASPEFEAAWAAYPKRAGSNSRADARKAWTARVRGGAREADMLAGMRRYAAFCEATGKVGTEWVMQAARFFGPGLHFEQPWTPPAPNGAAPLAPPRASPLSDEYAVFDDLMRVVNAMGGYQRVPPEWHHAQSEPVRRAISAAGGLKALADADEIGFRIKRKTFAEALAAAANGTQHDRPREATA
ncbi:MAG TPA: hypothetical protein VFK04_12830 [Gemmatimonadaceae bacterium]|nr:hypothetical protein [Gemmatimonadaceae bacterium]